MKDLMEKTKKELNSSENNDYQLMSDDIETNYETLNMNKQRYKSNNNEDIDNGFLISSISKSSNLSISISNPDSLASMT